MKLRILLSLVFALTTSPYASADPDVYTWDPGCEHTMTTNHFELAPGASVEFPVYLAPDCAPEQLGGFLYFGYYTTTNSSRPLEAKHKVRLTLTKTSGEVMTSDSGAIYVELDQNTTCLLRAENRNRNKTVKIRLRSQSGL